MSGYRKFTTSPLPNDSSMTLDFAAFGDMGTIIPFAYPVSKMIEIDHKIRNYNFALLAGDIAYAGVSSG